MKKIITMCLLLVSHMAFGMECSEEKILEVGLEAIKEKYPDYKKNEPYQIRDAGENWVVFGTLPRGWRGGTPEALIAKSSCKVVKVQHGQ